MNDLKKLARDLYSGECAYSQAEGSDIIRNMVFEAIGEELPADKAKYRRWLERNGSQLFEIMEEVITAVHDGISAEQFGSLVEFENFDLGDKKEFIIENDDLFKVAQMATGVKVSHRQRIHNSKVSTSAFRLGVKIYAEMFEFLTGKINWSSLVDKVAKSFERKVATLITSTLFGAYDALDTNFKYGVNAGAVDDSLRDLIAKVGGDVQIVGTKSALSAIQNAGALIDADAQDIRNFGYVKVFEGVPCVELPNYYDKDLGAFDVPSDMLLIVPNQAIVKAGYEGGVEIYEETDGARKDYQLEMEMIRMVHLSVAIATRFGMIKITK